MLTIVAPDLVPTGDVCLGEYYCGERMGYHVVCRSLRAIDARSMCAEHVLGVILVISGILIRPRRGVVWRAQRGLVISI